MTLALAWSILVLAGLCAASLVCRLVYLAWNGNEGAQGAVAAIGLVTFCVALALAMVVVIR